MWIWWETTRSFRPSFLLLGWREAKPFPHHSSQKLPGESFCQLGFLRSQYFPRAQSNMSLNSTDYTRLWKGSLHLPHYVPSGPLEVAQSGQASDISDYYISEDCYSCTLNILPLIHSELAVCIHKNNFVFLSPWEFILHNSAVTHIEQWACHNPDANVSAVGCHIPYGTLNILFIIILQKK